MFPIVYQLVSINRKHEEIMPADDGREMIDVVVLKPYFSGNINDGGV